MHLAYYVILNNEMISAIGNIVNYPFLFYINIFQKLLNLRLTNGREYDNIESTKGKLVNLKKSEDSNMIYSKNIRFGFKRPRLDYLLPAARRSNKINS